ncbi:NUDIX domain-containing protein [Candidatus Latescibacterota bacterium]
MVKPRSVWYITGMDKLELPVYRFCPVCGGEVTLQEAEGFARPVCTACGRIIYVNPHPATCQVVFDGGRVLLTRRAVRPKKGWWCLPGGFIEWGESPVDAARRELKEETSITAEELSLVGVYDSITGKRRHVLIVAYEVTVWHGEPSPGDDTDKVTWFDTARVPELAFDTHLRALEDALAGRRQ